MAGPMDGMDGMDGTDGTDGMTTIDVVSISCESCVMRASAACDDCLVTFLCRDDEVGETGTVAVVLDLAEQRAVRMLADAGLVPTIRHRATG